MRGPRLIQRREMGTASKTQEDGLKNPGRRPQKPKPPYPRRALVPPLARLPITAMNLVVYLRTLISVLCLGPLTLVGGVLSIDFTNITGYLRSRAPLLSILQLQELGPRCGVPVVRVEADLDVGSIRDH